MNGLTCDIEFMIRYPYLSTLISIILIPCMTLIGLRLFEALRLILDDMARKKEDE